MSDASDALRELFREWKAKWPNAVIVSCVDVDLHGVIRGVVVLRGSHTVYVDIIPFEGVDLCVHDHASSNGGARTFSQQLPGSNQELTHYWSFGAIPGMPFLEKGIEWVRNGVEKAIAWCEDTHSSSNVVHC